MATTTSLGLPIFTATDNLTPLAGTFNLVSNATELAIKSSNRILSVADVAGRTALVTSTGTANISAEKPLMVWRADAPAGRNYEYTTDGSTWYNFASNGASYSVVPALAAGTNWTITNAVAEVDGRMVSLYFLASYNGTITVGAVGNITNLQMCIVPAGLRPVRANIPVDCQISTVDQPWTSRFTSTSVISLIGGLPVNVNQTNPAFHVHATYMLPIGS